MKKPFVLAIIPARGGSKGLPRKNVIPLAGQPLIAHTIYAAKQASRVDALIVNTDDDEIAAVAEQIGVEVVRRPEPMGSDLAKVDPLLIWSVENFEQMHAQTVDVVLLLYPTAPLRPSSAIDQVATLISDDSFDSALTLVEDTAYLWEVDNGTAKPTNYDPARRAPRQMEDWNQWRENKAVYGMTKKLLVETKCRLGGKIGYVTMSPLQSLDIDDADDLAIAEAILRSGRVRSACPSNQASR